MKKPLYLFTAEPGATVARVIYVPGKTVEYIADRFVARGFRDFTLWIDKDGDVWGVARAPRFQA